MPSRRGEVRVLGDFSTTLPAVSAQNNQQIVAAIAVAIAEEMGTDVSHIRIHSIKRV